MYCHGYVRAEGNDRADSLRARHATITTGSHLGSRVYLREQGQHHYAIDQVEEREVEKYGPWFVVDLKGRKGPPLINKQREAIALDRCVNIVNQTTLELFLS